MSPQIDIFQFSSWLSIGCRERRGGEKNGIHRHHRLTLFVFACRYPGFGSETFISWVIVPTHILEIFANIRWDVSWDVCTQFQSWLSLLPAAISRLINVYIRWEISGEFISSFTDRIPPLCTAVFLTAFDSISKSSSDPKPEHVLSDVDDCLRSVRMCLHSFDTSNWIGSFESYTESERESSLSFHRVFFRPSSEVSMICEGNWKYHRS